MLYEVITDASKVKIVPMKDFKKHDVRPIPGMPVNIDNQIGKIVSANGGRIVITSYSIHYTKLYELNPVQCIGEIKLKSSFKKYSLTFLR